MASAAEILPDEVHFVGTDPIISGTVDGEGIEAARADLFENGLFCIVPSPDADPNAVKLATDLIALLGARPLFFDPAEHDGMLAAVEHLPAVLAVTLLEMAVQQPTWRELRKLAGPSFESITSLASAEPETYRDVLLSNSDNVLRWIDAFSESLASVRQALVEGEPETITQRFEAALQERRKWLRDRAEGQWDSRPAIEARDRPNVFTDVFLGGLWRKRPKKDE
jgi:prephenate dehydrogenase